MQIRVETIAEVKSIRFAKLDSVLCAETGKEYLLVENGALTPDDDDYIQAVHGANFRYVSTRSLGDAQYAILDENGKIPLANMPASVFTYKGAWNAATNTPELADGVGTSGDTYRATHAGSVDFGAGAISFAVDDKAVYNGTTWEKWDVQDQEVPVGTYIEYAGTTAPAGYLACDGAAVSRSTYASLFGVLSTTYGAGDGSTTFNLPDARGLVMVGAGNHGTMTRANGTPFGGGSVGATRNDQMQGHRHFQGFGSSGGDGARFGRKSGLPPITSYYDYDIGAGSGSMTDAAYTSQPEDDGANGTPRTGDETRPAEIAVLVCIKF